MEVSHFTQGRHRPPHRIQLRRRPLRPPRRWRKSGIAVVARAVQTRREARHLSRVWLHVDLDVLDQSALEAVDSPGSPGLAAAELAELIYRLNAKQCIAGADFTIYDPDLDPRRRYPKMRTECITNGVRGPRPNDS